MSDVLVTVCGVSCACSGVFLIIGYLGFRMFGQSFVFSSLALLAPLWNLVSGAGRKNTPENRVEKYLDKRHKQKRDDPSATPYDAQAQAQNLDFDAQVQQALRDKQINDAKFSAPPGIPTELTGNSSSISTPNTNTPQSQFGRNRFGGVRGQPAQSDLPDSSNTQGNFPPIDNDPPSRSLRGRRSGNKGRGRDSNSRDDEIFGGVLDDDGDGFSDF